MGRVGYELLPGQAADWTFVVGRGFMVALPSATPSGVVATLDALVSAPQVEAEDLVALLPLGGATTVESFAVIVQRAATDEDGIPVSVIVRGEVAVDVFSVGGSRRFTAGGIRPWRLADFRAVTGLMISSQGQSAARMDGLETGRDFGVGTVLAHSLFWSLADFAQSDESTIIRAPRIEAATESDTILYRPGAGVTGSVVTGSGLTGSAETAPQRVRVAPADGPRCGFRLPDGQEMRLDTACHLGRRPRPPRIQRSVPVRLVTVASPTSAVSGTHLEIGQEGESVVVTDLGSTNGTIVTAPRGRALRLRPGESLVVLPGTKVDIGDGNIIEILPASGSRPSQ